MYKTAFRVFKVIKPRHSGLGDTWRTDGPKLLTVHSSTLKGTNVLFFHRPSRTEGIHIVWMCAHMIVNPPPPPSIIWLTGILLFVRSSSRVLTSVRTCTGPKFRSVLSVFVRGSGGGRRWYQEAHFVRLPVTSFLDVFDMMMTHSCMRHASDSLWCAIWCLHMCHVTSQYAWE